MGDHLALLVNRLLTESTIHAAIESRNRAKEVEEEEEGKNNVMLVMPKQGNGDLSSPRKLVECRICQDEDFDSNLETPCSCCGSLKYAHRRCVQRWCDEKGDTICEICHQPFKPSYSAPPPLFRFGRIPVNFRTWQVNRRELAQSQLMMQPVSTDHAALFNTAFEEPSSRSFIYRFTVAVIFIGLLILRHTLPIMVGGSDEFVLPLFILAVLRVAGILLLVYVTIMAIFGLRRRNQDEFPSVTDPSIDEESNPLDSEQPSHVIQIS